MSQHYWIWKNQAADGPHSTQTLQQMLESQQINADTLICAVGSKDWMAYGSFIPPPPNPISVTAPVLSTGTYTAKQLSDFVGSNATYYLSVWGNRSGTATFMSWNWPAFFIGPLWLLYRKMYGYFWLSILLSVFLAPAISLPGLLKASLGNLLALHYLGFAVPVIISMLANSWYRKHADRKIREVLLKTDDPAKQERWIKNSGGTDLWLPVLLPLGILLLIGLAFWIAINYT